MYDAIMLFVFGLILLIKGGDWFVDSASSIAARFRIPEILIGATVVSIGTTLPEVMVSATSAIGGHGEMAYGNAVGSIICNTALIAAITVAIRPSKADRKSLRIPLIFFFGTSVLYLLAAYALGEYSRVVGILLLSIFAVYMTVNVISARREMKNPELALPEQEASEESPEEKGGTASILRDVLFLAVGAALIALGANLLVDKGTFIAETVGIPESVIALTFVALGTSLPELVTAITSLIKGHGSLSLGNIIGANLFNMVLVTGVSAAIAPFPLPASKTVLGINASLLIDMPVMMLVMGILTIPTLIRGKLSRVQGFVLLAIYAAFCTVQFAL